MARINEATDSTTAVRNIISKDAEEGKDVITPCTAIGDWFVCMYIAARAGPIEPPIILNKLLIPMVTPAYSFGVDMIIMFIAPTAANDRPAERIPKLAEMNTSEE